MKFYYQLLSFILVLCFLSTIKAQDDFFSSDKSEIAKTKANKISFKTIYASSVSYNINKFKFSEWKYDKNGNLIECIRYEHGDNIIEYKQSYNYDLNGNLILAKIIFHDNSMKICRQHYKGTIKIDSSTFFISANHIDTTEFRYSFYDDGRVIKTEDMDQPGKIYSITNYTYNADGRLIGKYFDRVNKKISNTRTIYKYDPLGNNIEETCFNAFDSINYKYSYTYDKNKLKVSGKKDEEDSKGHARKIKY